MGSHVHSHQGDPLSKHCTCGHTYTVSKVTPSPRPCLFIFYLLNSHPLTVLNGGGLVTKSCPTLVTPWTVASEVPLSMGFSRQEYWSGLPFPSPGNLLIPGIKHGPPALQVDSLPTKLWGKILSYEGMPRPCAWGHTSTISRVSLLPITCTW